MPDEQPGQPQPQPQEQPPQAQPQPQQERLTPTLQYSLLCDAVAQDPNTNKLSLFGLFDKILQPSVMQQFFVVNRWTNGLGSYRQTIGILKPDLSLVVPVTPQDFIMHSRTEGAGIVSGFLNFNFGEAGVWWIEIRLDGDLVLAYPVAVLERSGATQPAQH
jgi:hypothetical protein